MKDRKTRREQLERQKRRARKFIRDVWQEEELANDESFVGKHSRTRVRCSDPLCCGNPRRISNSEDNKTIQERKADLDEKG